MLPGAGGERPGEAVRAARAAPAGPGKATAGRASRPVAGRVERRFAGRAERRAAGRVGRPVAGRAERRFAGRAERRAAGRVERPVAGRVERRFAGRAERRAAGRVERPVAGRVERLPAGGARHPFSAGAGRFLPGGAGRFLSGGAGRPLPGGTGRRLAGAAIFLASVLLFSVQPLAARALLPWYGGAPMVWAAALFFFQTALLGGYLYAHLAAARLGPRSQLLLHAVLLGAALFVASPVPDAAWAPLGGETPGLRLLWTLAANLGLPFLAGAATTPLVSAWLVRAGAGTAAPGVGASDGERPGSTGAGSAGSGSSGSNSMGAGSRVYRFFALSNAGSLLGLLAYPVAFEPYLGLAWQARLWTLGYFLLALTALGAGVLLLREHPAAPRSPPASPPPSQPAAANGTNGGRREGAGRRRRGLPVPALLAAVASFTLVAVTTHLTRDVAAAPFLWTLPLAVYLSTFILAFGAARPHPRRLLAPAVFLFAGACLFVWFRDISYGLEAPLAAHAAAGLAFLFAAGWSAHGEIARRRPPPAGLTRFYLGITAGGAAGGLAASLLSPLLFPNTWEYPLALVLSATAPLLASAAGRRSPRRAAPVRPVVRAVVRAMVRAVSAATAGLALAVTLLEHRRPLHAGRNFYGSVRVMEARPGTPEWRRDLWNGGIGHGSQWLEPGRRREPTLYYYAGTGIEAALSRHPRRRAGAPLSVGVIGLGTGALTVHAREGDRFRFYELDPQVEAVARSYFTYLRDAPGPVEVVLGDARLSLEREAAAGEPKWDALVLDAFTGDGIPVHLLTAEAFALYRERLAPDGVLVAHLSNRHVDLVPVVRAQALGLDAISLLTESEADPARFHYAATWVLVTWNADFLTDPAVLARATPFRGAAAVPDEGHRWTDDYSNLWRVLR